MKDRPMQFSITDSNLKIMKKRMQISSNNLFNNDQGNLPMSSNATLPIIALSSCSDFKQKVIQMPTNNKHILPDLRTKQIKTNTRSFNRLNPSFIPNPSYMPNSSTTSHRWSNQQQNTRYLNFNTPKSSEGTASNRYNSNRVPQQPFIPHLDSEYGHFLTYLRRQSLARLRRKQQEEDGITDHVETTITLNLNEQQPFQSTSHYSFTSATTDTTAVPMISITAKRAVRPPLSYHLLPPLSTTHRSNNTIRPCLPPISKNSLDDQLFTSSSLLITPRNSIADDSIRSPILEPYELYLNDDMLHSCYVSDDNQTEHRQHMFSTAV
jgi:hypothetical protein